MLQIIPLLKNDRSIVQINRAKSIMIFTRNDTKTASRHSASVPPPTHPSGAARLKPLASARAAVRTNCATGVVRMQIDNVGPAHITRVFRALAVARYTESESLIPWSVALLSRYSWVGVINVC